MTAAVPPPTTRGYGRAVYGDAERPAVGDIVHASDGRKYRVVERKGKKRVRGLDISPGPRRVLDIDIVPRQPCRKRPFTTEQAARDALLCARLAFTLRSRAKRRETRAYRCPDPACDGAWHLTSRPRWSEQTTTTTKETR